MLYAKIQDELGDYIARNGVRFTIATATSAQRSTLDWQQFPSITSALEAWGLTYDPLPEPKPEN